MKCKRHTVDSTSTIGVCSSCLRERLLYLAASAAITEDDNTIQNQNSNNPPPPPPLLIFPRSVSPYVTRRKSDAGGGGCNRRFLAAPQVDLGYSCKDFESNRSLKKKSRRFSNLFRARSEDFESNQKFAGEARSWISAIFSTGRSKKQPCYIEDVIAGRRSQKVFCRGMSPARDTETEEEKNPSAESIEETPGRSRRTPATATTKSTPGRRKSLSSGMAFCLSPLVRASPNCPFKRKIKFPLELVGNSGEVTAPEKPHISEAASFCANRSKKLVDLGRVNRRR